MISASLLLLLTIVSAAQVKDNIPIEPITNVNKAGHTGYFSDPYHVLYEKSQEVYISGTTQSYLECSQTLSPECAPTLPKHPNKYNSSKALHHQAHKAGAKICSAAGIHPFQSGSGDTRSWDAAVTLHVQKNNSKCSGIGGWSVIVHAHPHNASEVEKPPAHWIGDTVLVGSFAKNVKANYDGKYFKTPDGQLYLVYQKQHSKQPKRDGVVAWKMDNPKTLTPGSEPNVLLLPNEALKSEDYTIGSDFKLIETGNIKVINGTFVMAYSAGAFDNKTYKIGIAYSDTFLPVGDQQYRKVLKENPSGLWNSTGDKEVYYLLQAEVEHDGWHYVGDQVLAPGVPTVAEIGPGNSWVLLFAGYDPSDAPKVKTKNGKTKFEANYRRPYFVKLNVQVPAGRSVKEPSDEELQNWITPTHG